MLRPVKPLPVVHCCAALGQEALADDEARDLERVFKALADRHRVKILNRLIRAGGEPVSARDFEQLLGIKQPTVSYHLKQLVEAGLITREQRGSYAHFAIDPRAFAHVRTLLAVPAGA